MIATDTRIALDQPGVRQIDPSNLPPVQFDGKAADFLRLLAGAAARPEDSAGSAKASAAAAPVQIDQQPWAAFAAQQMAQAAADAQLADAEPKADETAGSKAERDFLDYMSKTSEEILYESILRERGLTKESLAALPPDERQRIEREIREEI